MHGDTVKILSPRTRLLKRRGFEVDCNTMIPPSFSVDGVWYKMLPKPVETPAPIVIQPATKPTWSYRSPNYLARTGIYTARDLERLSNFIMQPSEQAAIVNVFTRVTTGRDVNAQGIKFANFLDSNTLYHIARNTWSRIWA